ncbi:MAG: hypothetical protein RR998_07780 [Oscillospiraceae bacterium]
MAERTIVIIPPEYVDEPLQLKHLRVAAYCSVSTATEEQSYSFESQLRTTPQKSPKISFGQTQAFMAKRLAAET